jgi:hypothetical protein
MSGRHMETVPRIRQAGVAILAVFLLGACRSPAPSDAERCAKIWNADVPADMSGRFQRAVVYRWTDKAEDDGCGVLFISRAGGEWSLFGGVVLDDRVREWSRVSGERWGQDSPEGGPTEMNASVLPGGQLSLE